MRLIPLDGGATTHSRSPHRPPPAPSACSSDCRILSSGSPTRGAAAGTPKHMVHILKGGDKHLPTPRSRRHSVHPPGPVSGSVSGSLRGESRGGSVSRGRSGAPGISTATATAAQDNPHASGSTRVPGRSVTTTPQPHNNSITCAVPTPTLAPRLTPFCLSSSLSRCRSLSVHVHPDFLSTTHTHIHTDTLSFSEVARSRSLAHPSAFRPNRPSAAVLALARCETMSSNIAGRRAPECQRCRPAGRPQRCRTSRCGP